MSGEKKGLDVSAKSFITAIVVIFIMMVGTYGLTFIVPGAYMPFWQWALSPILVLGSEGNGSLIGVIVFLLVIGGVFNCLDKSGLMIYMLENITERFGKDRYKLLAYVSLFFMGMGSFIGSFEECVPLVPIMIALSIRLGWDALVGVGMSLLAIGCGFAAGVCNPFTVGVAQQVAGLPMFSGAGYRAVCFVIIYFLLVFFLTRYAKKVERPIEENQTFITATDSKMDKALKTFLVIMVGGILLVFSSVFVTVLQDLTMIIVAITFLAAGITASRMSGRLGNLFMTFWNGIITIFPAVFMILMANSIKYTLVEGNVLDTLLQAAIAVAATLPGWSVILFIYLIVLVMNFFISSGSAKAFLLMPLIVPVAEAFGISAQLCVLAFAFGDGFSNVMYPTNAVLLIALGISGVDYGKWLKWSLPFQLVNIVVTSGLLLLGFVIGY